MARGAAQKKNRLGIESPADDLKFNVADNPKDVLVAGEVIIIGIFKRCDASFRCRKIFRLIGHINYLLCDFAKFTDIYELF